MKVKGSTIFAIIMLAVLLMFFSLTFTYSYEARIVPLIICIFALGLMCLQFLVEVIPQLSKKMGVFGQEEKEVLGTKQFIRKVEVESKTEKETVSNKTVKMGEIQSFLWLLAFVCLIFLVGYLIAVPVFLFLFFKLVTSRRWVFSIVVTAVTWAVVYFSFIVLLKIPLYKGIIFALAHIG